MRRGPCPVAEPKRNQSRPLHVEERYGNARQQPRQMPPDRDPASVHRMGLGMSALAQQQVEQLIDGGQPPVVIEPGKVLVVAEPPADLGRSEPGLERLVRRRTAKRF